MCLLDLVTLLTETSPEEFITVSLWRNWTDRIDDQVLARPVVELAEEAQMDLPPGGWGVLAQHTSEFPFSTMSKENRRVLILLVATLAQDNTQRRSRQLVDAPSIGRMNFMAVTKLIAETTMAWSTWCRVLKASDSKDRLVGEIAARLGLSWPFSRRAEPLKTYLDRMPKEIGAIPGIGRKKLRTILMCVAQAVHELGATTESPRDDEDRRQSNTSDASGDLSPSHRSTQLLLQELLNCLKDSGREVIELRFGLDGRNPQTLAAIADRRGVTRERIRQIESKSLKLLKTSPLSSELRHSLDNEANFIWGDLAAGSEVVLSDIPDTELADRLNPTYRLSFAIYGLPVSGFLDGIATRVPWGWYRTAVDSFLIERVSFQLDNGTGGPFPAPIEVVAHRIEAPVLAVRLAVAFSATMKVYKGYMWKGPLGKRGRRSIVLHRILASMSDRFAIDTAEIVSIHNRIRPHSACSYRDAEMAMARLSHLFIQMGKGAWVAAGGVPLPSIGEVVSDNVVSMDQEDTSVDINSNTVAGAIAGILTEFGPLSMSKIVDHFSVHRDFQASSVGPILLTREDFLRMAPGIYGLTQHLSDKEASEKASRLLLTEDACAKFIRALRSGEPRAKFPLWTCGMEHEWCEWARDSATASIYSSLLVVVQPDQWQHASLEERERWKRIKQADSCYQIDGEVSVALPTESVVVKDLLAPILVASRQGHLGWVTINHLHGKRQNDRKALAYLGLLIAAGVVHAQDDWRLRHVATNEADELCDNLLDALHRTGRVRWDSSMGDLLKDRIRTGLSQSRGWITAEIAEALRGVLPARERENCFTAKAMIRARVELGIALASVDGKINERELERVRGHALMGVRDLGSEGASLIEGFIQETVSTVPDAIAVAKEIRKKMSIAKRQSLMTYLFMIAAEDGVFHEAEGRLLVLLQKALDIDPHHFETLYRSHAKDPRAVALLSEGLRKRESRENIEELVSLLML